MTTSAHSCKLIVEINWNPKRYAIQKKAREEKKEGTDGTKRKYQDGRQKSNCSNNCIKWKWLNTAIKRQKNIDKMKTQLYSVFYV